MKFHWDECNVEKLEQEVVGLREKLAYAAKAFEFLKTHSLYGVEAVCEDVLARLANWLPIDKNAGEWRCKCKPGLGLDISCNPAWVAKCVSCGVERPKLGEV